MKEHVAVAGIIKACCHTTYVRNGHELKRLDER